MKLNANRVGRLVSLEFCHRLNPSEQKWMLDNKWDFVVRTHLALKRDAEMNIFKHKRRVALTLLLQLQAFPQFQ
jgi:hypothetical protein